MKKFCTFLSCLLILFTLSSCEESKEIGSSNATSTEISTTLETTAETVTSTEEVTTVSTTSTTVTTIETESATESSSLSEHLEFNDNWTIETDENSVSYTSPDGNYTVNIVAVDGVMTGLYQTAKMVTATMALNADAEGYLLGSKEFTDKNDKTYSTIVGINQDATTEVSYGNVFWYTAVVDEQNQCIKIISMTSKKILDKDSQELKDSSAIFFGFALA